MTAINPRINDSLLNGVGFFWQGVKLILSPRFKRFIIIPVIVNFFLLIGSIALLAYYFSSTVHVWMATLPGWLTLLLGWLFWLIFWTSSLLICALIFTLLTNIIASPFYGLLAEKVEQKISDYVVVSNTSFLKSIPHTLYRELIKILYFIPWLFLCLVLFVFPPTLALAPFVWWLVLSWILAIQYIDYCPDNQQIHFRTALKALKRAPFTVLGFGGVVTLGMTIPGANLFVPPAAVAGGTALWVWLDQNGLVIKDK